MAFNNTAVQTFFLNHNVYYHCLHIKLFRQDNLMHNLPVQTSCRWCRLSILPDGKHSQWPAHVAEMERCTGGTCGHEEIHGPSQSNQIVSKVWPVLLRWYLRVKPS